MHKFMVALDEMVFGQLDRHARTRNISVQELLRATVVPDWIREEDRDGTESC
jgi:hypothetical protein